MVSLFSNGNSNEDETRSSQGQGRNQELVEAISDCFTESLRTGRTPTVEKIVRQHPGLKNEIQEVLNALNVLYKKPSDAPTANDETNADTDVDSESSFVGDYQIIRKIGQGGMGEVYEARQQSLGRRVALKLLPDRAVGDHKFVERFKREARATAKLHHTNIVPVYEVGQDGSTMYYAMQYIEGQGLDKVQKEIERLEGDQSSSTSCESVSRLIGGSSFDANSQIRRESFFKSLARVGASVADALNYAHERSIVHRDVKPSNLILDTDGVVWLADFGLAKTDEGELTETGDFLGTVRYMSPERFQGKGDHRGDIYALGVTLYELVTRQRAFTGGDRLEVIDRIANQPPRRPRDIDRNVPLDLETIVLKAMEKEPRRRYQSAAELADDLRRFVYDQPILARRASLAERTIRWTRKNKALTGAIVSMAIAIAALVVGTILIGQQRDIASANETKAKEESIRADGAAEQAKLSLKVTADAMTSLVESVQSEMRNHPELIELKQTILGDAAAKLSAMTEISDDSSEFVALKAKALILSAYLNYEIGNYEECQGQFENALNLVTLLEDDESVRELVYQSKSKIYQGLGSLAFEQHNQEECRNFYQLAYENDKSWTAWAPNSLPAQLNLAENADNVADTFVLLNERRWDDAERFHQVAFDIRKRLRAEFIQDYQLDYDYANSHTKLGDMFYGRALNPDTTPEDKASLIEQAKSWFVEGLRHTETLVEKYPDDNVNGLRLLAAFCERIADTSEGDEAHEFYRRSIEIKEELSPRLLMDRNFQRDLAVSWGRAAMHMANEQKSTEAFEYMNKCLTIIQDVSNRIPSDNGLKIDEMVTWYQIGKIHAEGSDEQKEAWISGRLIGEKLVEDGVIPNDHPALKVLRELIEDFAESSGDEPSS